MAHPDRGFECFTMVNKSLLQSGLYRVQRKIAAQKMSVTGITGLRGGNSLIAHRRLRKLVEKAEGEAGAHVACPAWGLRHCDEASICALASARGLERV